MTNNVASSAWLPAPRATLLVVEVGRDHVSVRFDEQMRIRVARRRRRQLTSVERNGMLGKAESHRRRRRGT